MDEKSGLHFRCPDADPSQCVTAPTRTSHTGCSHQGRVSAADQQGVQTVGLETMEGIKSRIYEGIVQQEEKDRGEWPSLKLACPYLCLPYFV
jgi:hypothetical protein